MVGNKCHIVWKIQISIVINKLKMSEDNFLVPRQKYEVRISLKKYEFTIGLTAQDTSNLTINVYNNCLLYIPRKQLKLKFVLFWPLF
jgi:hypothetical protein